jgi:hypothetical protein
MTEDLRGNRVRRILDAKRQPPEYQRLDYEPKDGGKSLLHDEFGLPKVAPQPTNKGDFPIMKEVSNKPVVIKASDPNKKQSSNLVLKKGIPVVSAQQNFSDDGFIPPKNNFVSVGQVETAWATKEVTGLPDTKNSKSQMVDNNWPETVSEEDGDAVQNHVETLQGMNPLKDLESSVRKNLEHQLQVMLTEVTEELSVMDSLDDFADLKSRVLGKNGILSDILIQFSKIPSAERVAVGQLVNDVIDQLKLEFEAKEYELTSSSEEDEEKMHEDYEGEPPDLSEEKSEEAEEPQATVKISSALAAGQFAIFIDDKLFVTLSSAKEAREVLTKLILGNNVPVENIQLIKRIPIDFGVILDD